MREKESGDGTGTERERVCDVFVPIELFLIIKKYFMAERKERGETAAQAAISLTLLLAF